MRIRPVLAVATACWAAATAAAFAMRPGSPADTTQWLSATVPAAALTHLDLAGLDGTVSLRAASSPADEVGVRVAVRPAGAGRWLQKPHANLGPVSLAADPDGPVLHLGLRGARAGDAETDWTITVPARFSARVDLHDGEVDVAGIAGGLQVSVDSGLFGRPGAIRAEVPDGRLDLDLGAGTIDARTSAASFGAVDLRATVGDTRLFLDGHEVIAPKAAGPGRRLRLDGDHARALSLTVTVGDARLSIR